MPKYVIEREVPGVDQLKGRDRQAAVLQSLRKIAGNTNIPGGLYSGSDIG